MSIIKTLDRNDTESCIDIFCNTLLCQLAASCLHIPQPKQFWNHFWLLYRQSECMIRQVVSYVLVRYKSTIHHLSVDVSISFAAWILCFSWSNSSLKSAQNLISGYSAAALCCRSSCEIPDIHFALWKSISKIMAATWLFASSLWQLWRKWFARCRTCRAHMAFWL